MQYERSQRQLAQASSAAKVLQAKLRQEREAAAGLLEERCRLQAELLNAAPRLAKDEEHIAVQAAELSATRTRAEALVGERAALAERAEALEARAKVLEATLAEVLSFFRCVLLHV
jgi:chromosome segregation ATPase